VEKKRRRRSGEVYGKDGKRICSGCRKAPARVNQWYCPACQNEAGKRSAAKRRAELKELRALAAQGILTTLQEIPPTTTP